MIHSQVFLRCVPSWGRIASSGAVQGARLSFVFGQPDSVIQGTPDPSVEFAIEVLAGLARREIPLGGGQIQTKNGFTVWEDNLGHRWGACVIPWDGVEGERLTRKAYGELFALNADRHLHRLWNFVPSINAESEGLENYRRFCVGRSEAFTDAFGSHARTHMPAGSAVGIEAPTLILIFLAGKESAAHFENPLQVPAYEYPSVHSPRAPSFARGTIVHRRDHRDAFISGTAAVRGHQSSALGDLDGQISTTLEMLAALGQAMNIGSDLAASSAIARQFVVYVRRPSDLQAIQKRLDQDLLLPTDEVTYLKADICRRELLLEIEGSMRLV